MVKITKLSWMVLTLIIVSIAIVCYVSYTTYDMGSSIVSDEILEVTVVSKIHLQGELYGKSHYKELFLTTVYNDDHLYCLVSDEKTFKTIPIGMIFTLQRNTKMYVVENTIRTPSGLY